MKGLASLVPQRPEESRTRKTGTVRIGVKTGQPIVGRRGLRDRGVFTEDEFQREKRRLLR